MTDNKKVEVEQEETDDEELVETEDAPKKEKEKKKAVRKRKSKKEKESPISSALRLAVETGKVDFGSKAGIKNAQTGKVKLLVVADNAPVEIKDTVSKFVKKSNAHVLKFEGSSLELGSICGKPFPVAVLSIYEVGTSTIMDLAKKA